MTQSLVAIKSFFDNHKTQARIAAAIPSTMQKYMTTERIAKITMMAMHQNPLLSKCTTTSILESVIQATELGLEPNGILGHAYLVPYYAYNKTLKKKEYQCKFIPGYKGLITLACRGGFVKSVTANVVYEKDEFDCDIGTKNFVVHKPYLMGPRGDMVCAYAIAQFDNGANHVQVCTKEDIDKAKAISKSKDRDGNLVGPWKDHESSMWCKTAIRQGANQWPLSPDMMSDFGKAIMHDNQTYTAEESLSEDSDILDTDPMPPLELPDVLSLDLKTMRPDKLLEVARQLMYFAQSYGWDNDETVTNAYKNASPENIIVAYNVLLEKSEREKDVPL